MTCLGHASCYWLHCNNADRIRRPPTYIADTIPAFAGAFATRTTDMISSIARFFHAWRRYDIARRELSDLSDRDLADIGISRSEIERVAYEHARG